MVKTFNFNKWIKNYWLKHPDRYEKHKNNMRFNMALKRRIFNDKYPNLCLRCFKNKRLKGHTYCLDCYNDTMERTRIYRKKAKKEGLCERCFHNIKMENRSICKDCYKKMTGRNK